VFKNGRWVIDSMSLEDGLSISGWVISPENWFGEATFTVNGRQFTKVEMEDNRPDVSKAWRLDPGRVRGFRCWIGLDDVPGDIKSFRLAYAHGRTLVPLAENQFKYVCEVDSPLPEPAQRARVGGTDSLSDFLKIGAQNYGHLAETLNRVLGKTFDDFDSALDWGCGCGRALRYLAAKHQVKLTGVDIDAQTVAWCKRAYPRCSFHAIDLNPPMPLDPESFDLIYGISVFTHIREHDQYLWLEELKRVSRPGAVLLLSIHGDHAWLPSPWPASDFVDWKRRGFWDIGSNHDLREVLPDPDYYRSIFHDSRYVIREWGKFFKVVEIIPGLLQDNQDMVVLVKE
jgi:SAM-dependent methyltransferase